MLAAPQDLERAPGPAGYLKTIARLKEDLRLTVAVQILDGENPNSGNLRQPPAAQRIEHNKIGRAVSVLVGDSRKYFIAPVATQVVNDVGAARIDLDRGLVLILLPARHHFPKAARRPSCHPGEPL